MSYHHLRRVSKLKIFSHYTTLLLICHIIYTTLSLSDIFHHVSTDYHELEVSVRESDQNREKKLY